jgi:hypothetical protein
MKRMNLPRAAQPHKPSSVLSRSSQRWVVTGPPPEAAIIFQLLLDGKVTIADVEAARDRASRPGK